MLVEFIEIDDEISEEISGEAGEAGEAIEAIEAVALLAVLT